MFFRSPLSRLQNLCFFCFVFLMGLQLNYLKRQNVNKMAFKFLLWWQLLFSYVADIYDKVSGELERSGDLDCECIGGGRIKHDAQEKKIHVYGYSMVRHLPLIQSLDLKKKMLIQKVVCRELKFANAWPLTFPFPSRDLDVQTTRSPLRS